MNITESIILAFNNLQDRNRFFVSEADFQSSFAWELSEIFKNDGNIKVYREFPIRVFNEKWHTIYIDIMVVAYGQMYPIELKYKTLRIDSATEYENTGIPISAILKNQGAPDQGCYDFWRDISRIEGLVAGGIAHSGICICITNDKYYWAGGCDIESQAYAFRIDDGCKECGCYEWNLSKCSNPEKILTQRPNLEIQNGYDFVWHDFYEMPHKNALFKSLIIKIPPKEKE